MTKEEYKYNTQFTFDSNDPHLVVNSKHYHLKTVIDYYKTENVLELIACIVIDQQKEEINHE